LEGLKANKLRSILTMLGIIIGVAAVITMVSLGLGVQERVRSSIASLGSNLLIVLPGGTTSSGARMAYGTGARLTYDDAKGIEKSIDNVAAVAPAVSRSYQVVYGNQNWTTSVEGTTPSYMQVRDFAVKEGSSFTVRDLDSRGRVAVVGKTVAENLFAGAESVGQTIRINKAPFRVLGVLESKGQSAGGQDQDDVIFIPLTTAQQRMMGITYVQRISIQAASEEAVNQVQDDVTEFLRIRHRIRAGEENDFSVRNLAAVMEAATESVATITVLLGFIAAISLLVGGIGIMNIMLVSVTERTREIGIRKALGATFRDILLQFLIEAIVIGIAGGLIGIGLGVAVAYILSYFSGWATIISFLAIFVSFVFSVAIGLFFGLYPARKAALLDPIEALRYE
jgi:putative ABC transport system permease protein